MSKTVITHNNLGEISISQSLRARRISISVKPDGRVSVSMPKNVALVQALRFLESKSDWIMHTREKIANNNPMIVLSMPYSTREHQLLLAPTPEDCIRIRLDSGKIVVLYPLGKSYHDKQVQEAIRKGIEQAWREEAKKILPERLDKLARMYGFRYRSVAIRNTISKWGSCSSRDDISLSLHLMRLPDHLINYILLHELCHTLHKNHGPEFNSTLDKLTGGQHPQLRKELRGYHARW